MQEEVPVINHPFSSLTDTTDPNALTYLIIGLIVGFLAGIAIMKVRSDQQKNKD